MVVSPLVHAEVLSGWTVSPNSYANGTLGYVDAESCVVYSGYVYCVGGSLGGAATGAAFYAQLNTGSNGAWTSTTAYPTTISADSCVAYSGYIYCVGGVNGSSLVTSEVYYASLSSSGIGTWTETTDYGAASGTSGVATGVEFMSCAASAGYIYCVAGATHLFGVQSNVYYAALSSSGVGAWSSTTGYPFATDISSCAIYGGYIYCVGGSDNSGNAYSRVYSAPVSSSGVGSWTETTDYGDSVTTDTSGLAGTTIYGTSCAVYSGYLYCIAGYINNALASTSSVYYAVLSSGDVGAWASTTSYTLGAMSNMPCVASSAGYIYCIGGQQTGGASATYAVYYAQVQGASPVPDLPYGVIPLLLAIPALYYLISRRQTARGTTGTIGSGK